MRTPDVAVTAALAHAAYRKSSHSSATGSCVMMGSACSWVGIQDSKEHPDSTHRTTLAMPGHQWTTFLHAIKDNQLNL